MSESKIKFNKKIPERSGIFLSVVCREIYSAERIEGAVYVRAASS